MSTYKRGDIYWYKFMWKGELVRESTKQGNDKVARQMEAAHKTSLAKGEVGIRDKKPAMTLAEFCDDRFEPWARATFGKSSPKTWLDFLPRWPSCDPKLQTARKPSAGRDNERTSSGVCRVSPVPRLAGEHRQQFAPRSAANATTGG